MRVNTLFDMSPSPNVGRPHISVLPCSVLELEPEPSRQRRSDGGHDTVSSRAEYSHFPTQVGDLCFQLFLREATQLFDPFAGWGERASLARTYGVPYVGVDCNPDALLFARERYGVENTLGDSRTFDPPCFDGLITCPPYWNLEPYSDAGLDATESWEDFMRGLCRVFERAYDAAQVGAMFCILSGDWRADGVFYDLTFQIASMMQACGATPIDSVIVSRLGMSKIKIMIPQAVRLGYTVKVHETLNVFQKR